MAMLPFCGYNFADYWTHWLSFGQRPDLLPKIFHVNWFRKDTDHAFMWPGFGENLRILDWIIQRCSGKAAAVETAIGMVPDQRSLNLEGLGIPTATMQALLEVNTKDWLAEMANISDYLDSYGSRTPAKLLEQCRRVTANLS
jgi:phosphoenolpyruvate carboxykinase (GTP)